MLASRLTFMRSFRSDYILRLLTPMSVYGYLDRVNIGHVVKYKVERAVFQKKVRYLAH